MKKPIFILSAALLLTSCGLTDSPVGELESSSYVEVTSNGARFTKEFEEIEFMVRNTSHYTLCYGVKWELEKRSEACGKLSPMRTRAGRR